jgi:ssRNA-specific RNase YbeY (16S rRNA maturation enzyme)
MIQMAPRFNNVLWVQERNPDVLSFPLKKSQQANPLQVPQWGPCGEGYLLTGHFYISLNIALFIFSSESLVREPPLWTGILSPELLVYLFIHSFMYVCRSPQKGPLLHMGKT